MVKAMEAVAESPLPRATDRARLLSLSELADWWGVSRKHIWELSTKHKGDRRLPSYKIGRRRLFIYDECYWYLKKHGDS